MIEKNEFTKETIITMDLENKYDLFIETINEIYIYPKDYDYIIEYLEKLGFKNKQDIYNRIRFGKEIKFSIHDIFRQDIEYKDKNREVLLTNGDFVKIDDFDTEIENRLLLMNKILSLKYLMETDDEISR